VSRAGSALRARLLAGALLLGAPALVSAAHGINRALADDPSPYLQLHARDPVHWQPWNAATLEAARGSGRPLFISVGYFSCHWCHVMRRESFSDAGVAEVLNTRFIPVKVDRELEPVLDEYLNSFVQATRGYSGWPLNVFLTPGGHPLLGTVYLPIEQFRGLLERVAEAWQQERAALEQAAAEAAEALYANARPSVEGSLDDAGVARTVQSFVRQSDGIADELAGGFGVTSKFPSVPQLRTLLLVQQRHPDAKLAAFLMLTLRQMADKGLRDHLGGGFFRYTTDAEWLTPHFEKMLYDNALMAELYLHAAEVLDTPAFAQVAYATLDFMLAELWRDGAFDASLSSVDDHDVEGGYYLWDGETLARLLDDDERKVAGFAWQLTGTPSFERGYLPIGGVEKAAIARHLGMQGEQVAALLTSAGNKLRAERRRRALPRDGKQLTGWNGLALSALARAAASADGGRYLAAARELGGVMGSEMWTGSELLRARGTAGRVGRGSLQDYAYAAAGLLALARTSRSAETYALVHGILADAWRRFHGQGGWRRTSASLIPMLPPSPALSDGATPSPSAALIAASLETAVLAGDDAMRAQAEEAMRQAGGVLVEQPFFYAGHVAVLVRYAGELR
jgi:hypothetical protein